jgi:hypothetical protein
MSRSQYASIRATLFVLAALAGPRLTAQDPSHRLSQPMGGFAVVAGVAFDSLHGGPLVGAQISIEGSTRGGVSDSAGRFQVDSLSPGQARVGLFHPTLDSLAIGVNSQTLTLRVGDTLRVTLAVPSAETLVTLLCPGTPIPVDSGGGVSLLIGRILDAETEEPINAARVAVSWTDIAVSREIGLQHIERSRDTATGASGAFHFCWLPSTLRGVLHAARSYHGEVLDRAYGMEDRFVSLVTIHVPSAAMASAASGATLAGHVVREDGKSISGARVRVLAGTDSATTDDGGRFILHGLPIGSRTLLVRAVGYQPVRVPVELSVRVPQQVIVPLGQSAVVLKTVVVTGRLDAGYRRVGFDRRKAAGLGRYLNADEIEKRSVTELRDLLLGMPGLQLTSTPAGQQYLMGSRGNQCVIYMVDGHRFREYNPGDADAFVHPRDIGAIEVYEPSDVPPEIVFGPGTACTVVVIWTKIHLGTH